MFYDYGTCESNLEEKSGNLSSQNKLTLAPSRDGNKNETSDATYCVYHPSQNHPLHVTAYA